MLNKILLPNIFQKSIDIYVNKKYWSCKKLEKMIPNPHFALKTATTLHLITTKRICSQLGLKKL